MVECIPRADLCVWVCVCVCVCVCVGGGGGIFRDSQWGSVIVNPLEGEVGGYWLCRDKIHLIPPCDSVIFL